MVVSDLHLETKGCQCESLAESYVQRYVQKYAECRDMMS